MESYFTITIKPDMTAEVHTHKNLEMGLSFLQKQVGGYIQIVPARLPKTPSVKGLQLVLNEEGKLIGLPYNKLATVLYGNPYDDIVGDVLICSSYNPDPDAEPDVYAMCKSQFDQVMSWISSFVKKDNITEVAV